jgi:hypothetical protein
MYRFLSFFFMFTFACPAAGQVVINEVFHDPDGNDTGKEKIEIRNMGSTVVDLTGYDLYPDGTGYFTFPLFSLSPGALAVIHLRQTGSQTGSELFHPTPTLNMGNTSGSVALFSGTTHNAGTLVSFVQWGAGGEAWASTAVSSGVWNSVSDSVPAVSEGHSLEYDGSGLTAADWFDQANPTLGSTNSLPVQLLSFSARPSGASVLLSWETASEVDNYGFNVQRREISLMLADAHRFETENEEIVSNSSSHFTLHSSQWSEIGFVPGWGTSQVRHRYSFVDSSPYPEKAAYRLRQVDRGGSFSFSEIIEVNRTDQTGFLRLDCFPNPFNPSVQVKFSVPENGEVSLRVYDSAGRMVESLFSGMATKGTEYTLTLRGENLASGSYVAACEFRGKRISRKILLIR